VFGYQDLMSSHHLHGTGSPGIGPKAGTEGTRENERLRQYPSPGWGYSAANRNAAEQKMVLASLHHPLGLMIADSDTFRVSVE
jgi:hypothetical protein